MIVQLNVSRLSRARFSLKSQAICLRELLESEEQPVNKLKTMPHSAVELSLTLALPRFQS